MNKILAFLSGISLLVTACVPKPLDIEIEPPPSKLVVYSHVIPNTLMVMHLSRSFSALSYSDEQGALPNSVIDTLTVNDGFVTISYRGKTDTLYNGGPGIFYSLFMPTYIDEEYTLYARDNEKNLEVTATERMLAKVSFDTLYPVVKKTAQDTTVTFHYTFTDPPGDNWYVINYFSRLEKLGDGIDIYDFFSNGTNLLVHRELISDKEFGGGSYTATFTADSIRATDSVAVTLSNISETYFRFLGLREKAQNWFAQVTNEPINYPTNVNGGYGFFSTHHPDIRQFYLKEY